MTILGLAQNSDVLFGYVLLLIPIIWSSLFGFLALRVDPAARALSWVVWRRRAKILTVIFVPAWLTALAVRPGVWAHSTALAVVLPFTVANFFAEMVKYRFDRTLLEKRWATIDLLRLSWWGALSFPAPLLAAAIGIETVHRRSLVGLLWLVCAGLALIIATVRRKAAEGFTPRQVKSGELYKRTLVLSKRIGVRVERVSVVPFGKGRLTNAFGGWRGIAITDDYGHWLKGAQLDFVIGHELEHVRRNHALKKLAVVAVAVGLLIPVAYLLPQSQLWNFVLWWLVVLTPLLAFYFTSRRFEYAADRAGVEAVGQGEVGIEALQSLYRHSGSPTSSTFIEELFSTHPSLERRLRNIAVLAANHTSSRRASAS